MVSYKVDPVAGAKAALRWMMNPVSINGASQVSKISFALGGPGLDKKVEQMRSHPDGARVLADRPDLGAVLNDLGGLGAMPDGSFGRAYHGFMSKPEAVPEYLLSSLMYRGGEWDALDWSEDMRYVFERLGHTHDLIHTLSGYGTHLASEAVNIGFDLGLGGTPEPIATAWAAISGAVLWPTIGPRSWRRHLDVAYTRGRAAHEVRPFHCTYFEELLPRPLDEVRAEWGIEPLTEPLDTTTWLGNPLAQRMANGYSKPADPNAPGKAHFLELAQRLVEAGVPVKRLVNLDEATLGELLRRAEAGATVDELVTAAA